ncbi:permease [Marmoricola endophyticus]|uniref:Permease n=1 Tax=Marmoricola endophyticus TaxID=2040280 RepID=A0A917BJF5_9ACTN|nr:permease [Marmoricola endophyticus]
MVLSALCLVVNAGVSRVVLRAGVDAGLLTTARVTGTVVLLLAAAAVCRRSALVPPGGRLLVLLVVHGAIGVAALQWTYFVAVDRLPVSLALLLEYQAPVLVALWARLVQRESVRPRLWWGLALAVLGLAAATEVWQGARFDLVGVLAGVGAALTFSAYFLLGEAGVGAVDPVRVMLWSFLVAAVAMNLLAPLGALDPGLLGRTAPMLGALDGLSVPVWAGLAWIVVVGTLVPFGLILVALTSTPATTVTMVAMLEPVGVAVLGWAWFGESLSPVAIGGILAVVVGILLAQSARRPHLQTEPPSLV